MGASDLNSVGQSVRRKEDYRFLTGSGQFTQTFSNIPVVSTAAVRTPCGNPGQPRCKLLDSSIQGATLADLNDDGLPELIVTGRTLNGDIHTETILWNRDGVFTDTDTTALPDPAIFPTRFDWNVKRIDVNLDGSGRILLQRADIRRPGAGAVVDQPQLAVAHQHRGLADHRIFGDAALEISGACGARLDFADQIHPRGAAATGILVALRALGDFGDQADDDGVAADDAEEFSDRGARQAAGRERRQSDGDLRAADGEDSAQRFAGSARGRGRRSGRRIHEGHSGPSVAVEGRPQGSPWALTYETSLEFPLSRSSYLDLNRQLTAVPPGRLKNRQPITIRVRGPMRAISRRNASAFSATHPAVGAKPGRAMCTNTALPRPAIRGRVLWSSSTMRS